MGDLSSTVAGSGLLYSEMPVNTTVFSSGFNLWIALSESQIKYQTPEYELILNNSFPLSVKPGVSAKIISGTYDSASGPFSALATDICLLDLNFTSAEAVFTMTISVTWNAIVVCYSGVVMIQGNILLNSTDGLVVA